MATTPFLTILTASLNSGATLRGILESLMAQKFKDFEHIVVDGGSRDHTIALLQEFEGAYELRWVSEPDRGIADALNKALRKSQGTYILVLQADDRLADPQVLERAWQILRDEEFDIHAFPVLLDHASKGRVFLKPIAAPWWNHFKTIFRHQGTFVHRRVFDQIGGFDTRFSIALDYDFFYRALKQGCRVKFETVLPIAIMGGEGISSQRSSLKKRLKEEALVQQLNEPNPLWRSLQRLFRALYFPYKVHLLPFLKALRSLESS